MPVMTKMRQSMKTILMILVLAFLATIVFEWGMGGLKCGTTTRFQQGVIAVVNGQDITREQYDAALENELTAYRQRTGQDVDDYGMESIRSSVWDRLVENVLLSQEVKKLGLEVTDEEIKHHIFEQPPDFVREVEVFKGEDGNFDLRRYQAALQDERFREYWIQLERLLRLYLPQQKLQDAITASVRVTDDEVRREYQQQKQRARVKYIFFDPTAHGQEEPEISPKEVLEYYRKHRQDFTEPEKRKIDYVLFSTQATAADTAEVWRLAEEILSRARQGEDFADLAETYSEDPGTSDKGGDLGYVEREAMLEAFSDAAFAAPVGAVVGPVKTIHGLHIIKVEDKKREDGKEKVKARHILLKFGPLRTTIENANYAARNFADRLREGEDFYALARAETLEVHHSDFFPAGGFVPELGRDPQTSRFIFTARQGTTSGAIRTDRGFVVLVVAGIQKEHVRPVEDVEPQIRAVLTQERNRERSRHMCEQAYQKVAAGMTLEEIAAQDSLQVKTTDWFTMAGFVPGVGREPQFLGAAFGLEKDKTSKPIEGRRGYYLLQVVEREKFNTAEFEAQKQVLKQQLLQRKRNRVFQDWLADLKKKASIRDFRGYYGY
ncbi:MAG: peptidylprolyl isomerase [bacterium]|jgi:parvulin-like peptidyl-prolyl isomerase|nr:peptidylprolyl isomerase [bacterium]